MSEKRNLDSLRRRLESHFQSTYPAESPLKLNSVDITKLDASMVHLLKGFLELNGDIEAVNDHFQHSGSLDDFHHMLLLEQAKLEAVVKQANDASLKRYLSTLLSLATEVEQIVEEQLPMNLKKTADLDEGLAEFRQMMADEKLSAGSDEEG